MFFAAGFAFFCAISAAHGNGQESTDSVKLNIGAFEYAKELIKQGHIVADGRGEWGEHALRQWQRMSSFVSMVSANMQNGISGSTIGTPRIRNEDTNFPTAISRTFIAVGCLLHRAGQANINITKLKMRRLN